MTSLIDWFQRKFARGKEPRTSATLGSPTSSGQLTPEQSAQIVNSIRDGNWWQGSIIDGERLEPHEEWHSEVGYWVVATQTCNLYNRSLERVGRVELIAAKRLEACTPKMTRGDDPRLLHAEAKSGDSSLKLEIDLQLRRWILRQDLAKLPPPSFALRDSGSRDDKDNKWLDSFIGWVARSYNRVGLPDEFNEAFQKAKLRGVFAEKLARKKDQLYGVYLSIQSNREEGWDGELGLMPPPYNVGVVLVTQGGTNPDELNKAFIKQVFQDKVEDPEDSSKKVTRAELAVRYGIRLIQEDFEARTTEEITLADLKNLIRYSFIDYLSDSSAATPPDGA